MKSGGQFVISLDFELFWGVRDKRRIEDYASALEKVHALVPEMLAMFREYFAISYKVSTLTIQTPYYVRYSSELDLRPFFLIY